MCPLSDPILSPSCFLRKNDCARRIAVLDWDDFQKIPGCMTGYCTDIKDIGKRFLGGMDLREQADGEKLKSIDDFNKAQSAGGAEAAPVLERLRNVLFEVGIDKELFDQVVDGMKKENEDSCSNESELLGAVREELGKMKVGSSPSKSSPTIENYESRSLVIDRMLNTSPLRLLLVLLVLICLVISFLN